jgi:hypothetical protein
MADVLGFAKHPQEFIDLMAEFRSRYDFIPAEIKPDGREV